MDAGRFDAVVAGGGPAGLSAAAELARGGFSVLVLEQDAEVGSPTRTSGGSFSSELDALGIPAALWHPVERCRFLSPKNCAEFVWDRPVLCVMDVRGVCQHLAERAIQAGARVRPAAMAVAPILKDGFVSGVKAKDHRAREAAISCDLVIDATGYRSMLMRQAGLDPEFRRFGVGAEYDLYAPHYDQREAVLIVGSQIAPSGYAWAFPWGRRRVRVGVGIIHADSAARPDDYLDRFVADGARYGLDLRGAQPVEYHFGLIPSELFPEKLVGNGILGAGDAAGQASALVGEGIRWAIKAGRMAGEAACRALALGDVSRSALAGYEKSWRAKFGADLRLAHEINKRIARWEDHTWDENVELLGLMSPREFGEALKTNLVGGWLMRFLLAHPRALARAAAARLLRD